MYKISLIGFEICTLHNIQLIQIAVVLTLAFGFTSVSCYKDEAQTELSTDVKHRGASLPSGGTFIDVTHKAGIKFIHSEYPDEFLAVGAGVVIFDFNGDRLNDIFLPNSDGPNFLYRNNGDSTFIEVAKQSQLDDPLGRGNGGCVADYDNDGDQDMYATNYGSSKLYNNSGDGTFHDVTERAGLLPNREDLRDTGCSWGDYNLDGNIDLVVTRHIPDPDVELLFQRVQVTAVGGVSLFSNLGNGTFIDATPLLGNSITPRTGMYDINRGNVWGAGFQPGWIDLDNDHDPDLYVVNDMGDRVQPNVLWRNDGLGENDIWQFSDISEISGAGTRIDGMALAVGDYNLDGNLDLFMTDIGTNVLLENSGDGLTFTDKTEEAEVGVGSIGIRDRVTWGAMFFDYDNDGLEDLYVVSGHLRIRGFTDNSNYEFEQPNVLLKNTGNSKFKNVSLESGADDAGVGRGGAFFDYNNDGCLDIFVVNYGQQAKLFQNQCIYNNNWIMLHLEGTLSNKNGIGARVEVTTGEVTQIREISGGSSHMGQNMPEAHFGIGNHKIIDSIKVMWPSGHTQLISLSSVNKKILVKEAE